MSIDLNADVGEGLDAAILPLITSANIACGGHAGDLQTMRTTVELAVRYGVGVGAHPGYPDREGFGRREIDISDDALRDSVAEQLQALVVVARDPSATQERFEWVDLDEARRLAHERFEALHQAAVALQ